MSTPPEVVPRRRKLVLSLRLLLALVAIFALWAARVVNQARHQARVVAAIQRAGGHVLYDDQYPFGARYGESIYVSLPRGPGWRLAAERWVSDRLGVDYVHEVDFVTLGGPELVTDADLALVGQLGTLKGVKLATSSGPSSITEAGVAHLAGLRDLLSLSIEGPGLNDAGLLHLSGLKRLQCLTLRKCSITGPGLVAFDGMPDLQTLILDGNPITDIGSQYLEGLSRLRTLSLEECPLGEAGLESLAKLPALGWVCLTGTRVTKEQAAELHRTRPKLLVDITRVGSTSSGVMTPPPAVLPPPRRPASSPPR